MTNPFDNNKGQSAHDETRPSGSRQETILLTSVPTATQLTEEPTTTQFSDPSLSSNALAALSQRYDVLAEAGHGAMGNVYKARDRETGETVALKLLKPEIASDQAMIDRFKNELLFARKITHKNVCRVHEFNRIGGIAFTSMEFVEGESLRAILSRFGGFPTRKGIELALQICAGLQEAHAQGIVHRDLKPENVMIDANGNVKIMDFGIARSMEALTKLTGAMIGTPAYMAPEQVAGKSVDFRTDIYSLGLMLYEMFTGSQPFQAETAVAVALKQMREMPVAPHEVEPNIPVGLERVILKCLEKEPAKRYQTVAELATALKSPTAQSSNPNAFAPAAVVAASTPRPMSAASPQTPVVLPQAAGRQRSPLPWVLLCIFAALAGLSMLRARAIWIKSEAITVPPQRHAPVPPAIADETTVLQPLPNPHTPAEPLTKPEAKKSAQPSVPLAENRRDAAQPPARPANPSAADNASSNAQQSLESRQQHSEKILKQDGFSGDTEKSSDNNRKTYLWIGRYQKEDAANQAARKVEGFGEPVVVVPRHGLAGEFWAVLMGPVASARVPSSEHWLESQGFKNVHPVHNLSSGNNSGNNGSKSKDSSNE
jgi:serine/threonine protein kinase